MTTNPSLPYNPDARRATGRPTPAVMHSLYSFLYLLGLCIYLPRILWLRFRWGRPLGTAERLGWLPPLPEGGIWIHAVSVGEVRAARGLLPHLRARLPGVPVLLSTTTATGRSVAEAAGADGVFYMPLDLPWTVDRVLETARPRTLLLVETEIWPNLLRACRSRGIPVAVVNGRLSADSFRRYRRLGGWWRRVLQQLRLVCVRSPREAARFRALGIPPARVFLTGNLKADAAAQEPPDALRRELAQAFRLNGRTPVLVAGCTMPGEEALVLEAFAAVRSSHPDVRLLVAPRHPERFEQVAADIAGAGWSCRRRTGQGPEGADVLLLDSIGELSAAYGLAVASFVGGSLVPAGGHNLLEPAACGQPVLFGPSMDNFAALAAAFRTSGAGLQVRNATELARGWKELLEDEVLRETLGRRARLLARHDSQAGRRTAAVLARELGWTHS